MTNLIQFNQSTLGSQSGNTKIINQNQNNMEQIYSKIEAYLAKRDPSKPSPVPHVFKFVILKGGSVSSTWILDLKNFKISKGEGEAEVTLTLDEETLAALITLKVSAEEALASGKLNVTGAREVALRIAQFVGLLQQ